ncbi:efflux RND transporter periplasmic adaptor subunit [Caldithrix abyssi]
MSKSWFKSRRFRITLTAIVVLLIVFLFLPEKDQALLFTVKRGDLLIRIPVDGELQAVESFIVKAPSNVWGNIRIVKLAPEGSIVKKGDFLIQFDTSEQMQRLQEAQNKLETALANLASTKADIQNEMAELENDIKMETYSLEQARLQAKNAIYEAENKRREIELNLKKAELRYAQLLRKKESLQKIHQARLRQAELEVEQARLEVKQRQEDLKRLTIYSPADGLVVYKKVWESGGMTKLKVGYTPWRSQALIEIPSHSKMKVMASINENEISRVKKGQQVEVRLDAIKDTLFSGTVTDIATLARQDDEKEKNVFDIEILINEADPRLKPGMTAHCNILVQKIENVLQVPIDAVQIKEGKSFVLDEDGDPIAIKTGQSNDDFVVVTEGLKEGDRIQLRASASDTPAQNKVKPKKKKPKSVSRRVIILR